MSDVWLECAECGEEFTAEDSRDEKVRCPDCGSDLVIVTSVEDGYVN